MRSRLDRGGLTEDENWLKLRLCTEMGAIGVERRLKMAHCSEVALTIVGADSGLDLPASVRNAG